MKKSRATTWAAAKSAAELRAAIAEIDEDIAAAERAKARIEEGRGEFVLSGGDAAVRARELFEADERIGGLTDARALLAGRLTKVEAEQKRGRAEAGLEAAQKLVPELEAAYVKVHGHLDDLWNALEELPRITAEINARESDALALDYPRDRFVEPLVVRAAAAAKCPTPERGMHERHQYDADAFAIRGKQVATLIGLRLVQQDRASVALSNRHLLNVEMERQSRDEAATRRAAISAVAPSDEAAA